MQIQQLRQTVPGVGVVAATAYLPELCEVVAVCLPGGRFSRQYWDLEVTGSERDEYSFARQAAARGVAVIALDPLGTGESSRPEPEPEPADLTAASALAVSGLLARLGLEHLPVVGIAHSLGAVLMLHQQMRYRSFGRLALLGCPCGPMTMWRPDGSRWSLTAANAAGSQVDVRYTNLGPNLSNEINAAVRAAATVVPGPVADWVLEPGVAQSAAAHVDVPLFLGFGERDVVADPLVEVSFYRRSTDVRVQILQGAFHCHNIAVDRGRLWNSVIDFSREAASEY
ncbi:hypothetical protein GPOL_c25520 [Gordonia polyisoprenivorans VH2]|uniref:AB hydrolase-1 domain-containing protein n=1 Tax=Gordonia polyisoprenivorans (strain DSM 44266 / VH2) TaxID=1112204 RepID=H6N4J9_GORPV|nr:alpha/beta fold hydrolase [Gordonia polyisoprenivorans]AFA73581.1 hypothetical protein GPOL_c25520 [Gordonia polyisoprenivorans VH2]